LKNVTKDSFSFAVFRLSVIVFFGLINNSGLTIFKRCSYRLAAFLIGL